jgi:rfaE bifunctional protein kinase chain/domain
MSSNQQILRIDREETSELQRDQFDKGFSRVQFKEFDAVILSDYGKGVVTKYLMSKVIPKMAAKFMAVDPTGHDYSKYKGATIITPNLQEAEYAANMFLKDDASFEEAAKRLIKYTNNVLITRGKNGMVLFEEDVSPLYIPTKAKEVYDVSGAGDTVIAVLTLAVTSRYKLAEAAEIANKAAGIVVGKMGTATVSIEEINKSVERNI